MLHSLLKIIPNEAATLKLGADLAKACSNTAIIFLYGDLGAGKTTLARGFLQGFGYEGKVKSPTYTIVEPYEINNQKIFHFDLYRLQAASELEFIGWQDYLIPGAINVIEWPEKAAERLPQPDLSCYIVSCLTGREIRLEAHSEKGQQILKDFINQYGE